MALKYVEKKRPSLILLDLMMPGMGRPGDLCENQGEPGQSRYPDHLPDGG